jgi:hypothetical protein
MEKEILFTGLSALVMVSPVILAVLVQKWSAKRVRYSTRELVEMQRNKINNYYWNK